MARDLAYYCINMEVAKRYAEALEAHIQAVQEAGISLGVPVTQLMRHDASKWTTAEFPAYANWFYGEKNTDNAMAFERAWLNHLHHNPHHWQYYMFPDGWSLKGTGTKDGMIVMPYNYVLEMVADWMGASKVYSNTTDMTKWLTDNLPRIKLHPLSKKQLRGILGSGLGYGRDVVGLIKIEEVDG